LKIFGLIFLLLISTNFYGQNNGCTCLTSLDETSIKIKKSISYKSQIKNLKREQELESWKKSIEKEIINDSLSNYFCAGYLQKYISFIKDKHNEIYSTSKDISLIIPFYTKTFENTTNTNDSISGIYYQGKDKIIVKKESESLWFGILLESNSKDWKKGMIRLRIHKNKNDLFEIYEFYKSGLLFYQSNVRIHSGRIHSTFWNKENRYHFNKNHKANFNFENLNSSFNYIGIKTLKRSNRLMSEADKFYDEIEKKITDKNLIIDLRNNGGGSTEQIKPLIKIIKKNNSIEKIYVLVNFKTFSAAELGAYLLDNDLRTILSGENTRGGLTYGYGNNSISGTLDCNEIKYNFSRKVTNKKFLKYENIGLTPKLILTNKSDWIEQILELENK